AQSGKIDDTQKLFKSTIDIAKAIDDSSQRYKALSSIAQSLAQSGKIDEAQKLFESTIDIAKAIDDSYSKSLALSSIASALSQLPNQIYKAQNLFDESIQATKKAKEAIHTSKVLYDDIDILNVLSSIAQSLAQSGKIDDTQKLFDKIFQAVNAIDNSYLSFLLTEIIIIQLKAGKSYSKDLLEMINTNMEDNLYNIFSNSLGVSRELWSYLLRKCIGYPEIT